jgi:hypothetical protein
MASLPALTDEERAMLAKLAADGPKTDIPSVVRGRLALYDLIRETPQGWHITQPGKEALDHAPERKSPLPPGAERPGRGRADGRLLKRRYSPFG